VLEGPLTITQFAFDGAGLNGCPNTSATAMAATQAATKTAIACLSRVLNGGITRVACSSTDIGRKRRQCVPKVRRNRLRW
jgi:hypothetical protein